MSLELDDYVVVKMTADDVPEVVNFLLEDFLTTEPLNASVNLQKNEASSFFYDIINAGSSCPFNYAIRNKEGKMVAVRWACIMRRQEQNNDYTFDVDNNSCFKVQEIQRLLTSVDSKIWDLVPSDIDTLFCWLILSVHQSMTRRGLGKTLINHRPDELRSFGCQGYVAVASAIKSQQLFQKLGYQELISVKLSDWKNSNGEQIFCPTDGTSKVNMNFKRL